MAGIPLSGQSLGQLTLANGWPTEWFCAPVISRRDEEFVPEDEEFSPKNV
jgi:hypothetical protein